MAYSIDMRAAARRNLEGAEKLLTNNRDDVAAYLFGIAAECALKAMASQLPNCRTEEILYAHFPVLRRLLRDALTGRRAQGLLRLISDDGFMNQWEITMRYAPAEEVRRRPINAWADQARRAVNELGAFA